MASKGGSNSGKSPTSTPTTIPVRINDGSPVVNSRNPIGGNVKGETVTQFQPMRSRGGNGGGSGSGGSGGNGK